MKKKKKRRECDAFILPSDFIVKSRAYVFFLIRSEELIHLWLFFAQWYVAFNHVNTVEKTIVRKAQ